MKTILVWIIKLLFTLKFKKNSTHTIIAKPNFIINLME